MHNKYKIHKHSDHEYTQTLDNVIYRPSAMDMSNFLTTPNIEITPNTNTSENALQNNFVQAVYIQTDRVPDPEILKAKSGKTKQDSNFMKEFISFSKEDADAAENALEINNENEEDASSSASERQKRKTHVSLLLCYTCGN